MEELQQMRDQLALLKSKLNTEEIVNDRLLREITHQKVRSLNNNIWIEGLACGFVITFGSYAFRGLGCSWWFIGATILMMIFCFLATLIPHRRVKMNEIMNGDLLSVAKQVRELRQHYRHWLHIAYPMVTIWFLWFAYEIYRASDNWKLALGLIIATAVGAFIGGALGMILHRRSVKQMDDIIAHLEA